MIVTPRVLDILRCVACYGVLTAAQIRNLCFPNIQSDGSNVRSRLRTMVQQKLLNRAHMEIANPMSPLSAPVYYSSPLGVDVLATQLNDESYRLISTRAPQWQNLVHFVAIADVHILADQAVARQAYAKMERWVNEFDVVNSNASNPADRFFLYTQIQQTPKLVCIPDAAFVLNVQGFRKAFYLELERGTSPTGRVAAEKSPGYFALHQQKLHKKHFPEALDDFAVLLTAPDVRWRDALRRAFAAKDGAALFRFAAVPELTPENFLFGSVWHPCKGEPVPLVKSPNVAGGGQ